MRKLNYVKIILDTLMVVVFTLLFNKMVLGIQFHEVAGLAIGVIILVHCGMNWKWIKGVTLKLFDKKLGMKTRIGFMVDLLLLISFITIIISGVFISKVVFAGLALEENHTFKFLHITVAYLTLVLAGVHIGLHWNWVKGIFKNIVKLPQKKIFNYLSKVIVIFILVFGIYCINSVGFLSKIAFVSPQVGGSESKIERQVGMRVETGSVNGNEVSLRQNQPPKAHGEQRGNVSAWGVITSYLGVISVFAIITVYIEKLFNVKRKKQWSVNKDNN
jgi:hypothetical protein